MNDTTKTEATYRVMTSTRGSARPNNVWASGKTLVEARKSLALAECQGMSGIIIDESTGVVMAPCACDGVDVCTGDCLESTGVVMAQ